MPATPPPTTRALRRDRHLGLDLRLQQPGPCHGHLDQVLGLCGGPLPVVQVHPAAVLPDVGHFEQVGVQPRLDAGGSEGGLVQPGGAGGHDHPIELVLPDVGLDLLLARIRTGVHRVRGQHHIVQGSGISRNILAIEGPVDVQAAVADVDPYPRAVPCRNCRALLTLFVRLRLLAHIGIPFQRPWC